MKRTAIALVCLFISASACSSEANGGGGGGGDDGAACDAMNDAIAFSEGAACDGLGSCDSIPCVCADGTQVNSSSCFNGFCEGIETCEQACGGNVGCMDSSANNTTPNNTNPNNTTPNNTNPNNTTPIATGEMCPASCASLSEPCDMCEEDWCIAHGTIALCTRACDPTQNHADCPSDPSDTDTDRRWLCTGIGGERYACADSDRL